MIGMKVTDFHSRTATDLKRTLCVPGLVSQRALATIGEVGRNRMETAVGPTISHTLKTKVLLILIKS